MTTGPKNPLFPPISQQPTVGIFSSHANGLVRYQYIHWCCLLTFKTWVWCRIHHPEIMHISLGAPLNYNFKSAIALPPLICCPIFTATPPVCQGRPVYKCS